MSRGRFEPNYLSNTGHKLISNDLIKNLAVPDVDDINELQELCDEVSGLISSMIEYQPKSETQVNAKLTPYSESTKLLLVDMIHIIHNVNGLIAKLDVRNTIEKKKKDKTKYYVGYSRELTWSALMLFTSKSETSFVMALLGDLVLVSQFLDKIILNLPTTETPGTPPVGESGTPGEPSVVLLSGEESPRPPPPPPTESTPIPPPTKKAASESQRKNFKIAVEKNVIDKPGQPTCLYISSIVSVETSLVTSGAPCVTESPPSETPPPTPAVAAPEEDDEEIVEVKAKRDKPSFKFESIKRDAGRIVLKYGLLLTKWTNAFSTISKNTTLEPVLQNTATSAIKTMDRVAVELLANGYSGSVLNTLYSCTCSFDKVEPECECPCDDTTNEAGEKVSTQVIIHLKNTPLSLANFPSLSTMCVKGRKELADVETTKKQAALVKKQEEEQKATKMLNIFRR